MQPSSRGGNGQVQWLVNYHVWHVPIAFCQQTNTDKPAVPMVHWVIYTTCTESVVYTDFWTIDSPARADGGECFAFTPFVSLTVTQFKFTLPYFFNGSVSIVSSTSCTGDNWCNSIDLTRFVQVDSLVKYNWHLTVTTGEQSGLWFNLKFAIALVAIQLCHWTTIFIADL